MRLDFVTIIRAVFGDFANLQRFSRVLALAAGSQRTQVMKRIIGISAAVLVVILQLAGYAAWRTDAATDLAPVDGPELVHGRA